MNPNPVIAAETASELRQDIFKIGFSLCSFAPLCSLLASVFLTTYSAQSGIWGEQLTEAFIGSEFYPFYSLAVSLIPMLVCIFMLYLFFRCSFSPLMLKPAVSARRFGCITTVGLVSVPLASLVSAFTVILLKRVDFPFNSVQAPKGVFATIIFVLVHVIIAPFLEELFFRGLILERLRRYGDVFAVLTTAMMFSLLHSSLQSFPSAFISGLLFGLLAVWTGSFLSPAIVHALNNALSVITILLSANGKEAVSDLCFVGVVGIFLLLSATAFFILHKKNPAAFRMHFSGKPLKARRKAGILFFSLPMMIFIFLSIATALSAFAG